MQNSQSSPVIEFTLGVVALARPVVEAIQRKDRDLASWFFNHSSASQLRRAMSSVCLNLAEGFGCTGGHARLRFQTALGSLREVQAALRLAVAWGYVSPHAVEPLLEAMNHLGGRVFGLVRR